MRKILLITITASILFVGACSTNENADTARKDSPASTDPKDTGMRSQQPAAENAVNGAASIKPPKMGSSAARKLCFETATGDNVVQQQNTFAVDFEPVEDTCFVTAYNPEYDDPPMESVMAFYRDNKKVLDLPSQFNGNDFGCWVTAVAFRDVNGDDKTDIIVAGKCSARAEAVNENVVYVNSGKGFVTNTDKNLTLGDIDTIDKIIAHVANKENKFFD